MSSMSHETSARRLGLLACRLLVGGVFICAAISKLAAPQEFARAVYQYHLLPDWAINTVAVFLPWLELTCGVAVLAITRLRNAAAGIIGLLLLGFAGAIVLNLHRGIEVPCGCFAALGQTSAGWWHVAGDVLLSLMAFGIVFAYLLAGRKGQRIQWEQQALGPVRAEAAG